MAWATSNEVPDFGIDLLGEAGSQRLTRPGGQFTYVTGTVAPNSTKMQQLIDRSGPNSARSVIAHDLGHLVGLAHVGNGDRLVFPRAQPTVTEFGSGGVAGPTQLGPATAYRTSDLARAGSGGPGARSTAVGRPKSDWDLENTDLEGAVVAADADRTPLVAHERASDRAEIVKRRVRSSVP